MFNNKSFHHDGVDSSVGLEARLWVIKTWIIRRITITIAIMTRVGESVYNICFKSYCNQNKFGNKGNFSNSSLFFSQSVVTTLPHESWALQLSAPSAAAVSVMQHHSHHLSLRWSPHQTWQPCLTMLGTCNLDTCQQNPNRQVVGFIVKLKILRT